MRALRCIRKWHKQELLSILNSCSHYAKNIHSHNTRYTSKDNLYMTRFHWNKYWQTSDICNGSRPPAGTNA